MLYIFDNTEKLISTLPKGSFFNAIHREVLNGENTFQFSISADSEYNEHVVEGNLVAFRDLDSYWQVFEIKRLVDVHGDGLTRTAYCEHVFYELLDDIVTDKRPSADATAALAGMLENTRWQVGIVDDLGAASTSAYYISALEAVQKVAEAWQGELNWRCVINGGVITRYVDLRAMVGTDTGKQFAYSKDILSIEREVDTSGVVTALYGRGKGVETESGAYGRRLTFADIEAPGKPLGQEWIGDNDALARWGRPGGRHRFDVFIDEEETDPVKLLEKTRDELDRRKVPRVTYRLDVVSLEELTGYEHEKVRLGDLVRVIDREFKPELVVSARVVEIERDLFDPTNTKVVLGSFAPTIVEATVNINRRINEMANRPFNTKWLDGKISVLQNEIENVQSCVFQTADDGILILDAPTYDQATKAMRLGGGIFAIANQKDGQGGWNWRTFGTGSGFTADEINAGKVRAELVQIGAGTEFAEGYDPSTKATQDNLNVLQQSAQQAIADAEAAAKAYAEAQAAAAKVAAEAYADGIVTAEEQARIYHANQVLQEAKEHAETKAAEAQAAAEAVANQKFDAPGYVTATTEGIKVFDSSNDLRVLIGSWLKDAVRKYGIKIIDGEIYSSLIRSGAENASSYIQLTPPNRLEVFYNNALQMLIEAFFGGRIFFYHSGEMVSQITSDVQGADLMIAATDTGRILVAGDLSVTGNLSAGGSKPAQQVTENYGLRYLYAIESPEILYFDRYVGRLENGEAVIKLDPIFLECIEPDTELTPWSFRTEGYGENDIYVAEWGKDWVRVKERNGGTSNNKFVLWIEAVRRNYAGIRLMEVTN